MDLKNMTNIDDFVDSKNMLKKKRFFRALKLSAGIIFSAGAIAYSSYAIYNQVETHIQLLNTKHELSKSKSENESYTSRVQRLERENREKSNIIKNKEEELRRNKSSLTDLRGRLQQKESKIEDLSSKVKSYEHTTTNENSNTTHNYLSSGEELIYVVERGDQLSLISEEFTGSKYNWAELNRINGRHANNELIDVGEYLIMTDFATRNRNKLISATISSNRKSYDLDHLPKYFYKVTEKDGRMDLSDVVRIVNRGCCYNEIKKYNEQLNHSFNENYLYRNQHIYFPMEVNSRSLTSK